VSAAIRFRDAIGLHFGLHFDDDKLAHLSSILDRRAAARHVGADHYLSMHIAEEAELGALATELTVGETYFFRNFEQFAALRDLVLPERLAQGRPLRLLSAGCSSGEEPYSLAMLTRSLERYDASIRAADVNPAALARAAKGRYSHWSLRETPPDMLERWFVPVGRDVELDPAIRAAVQFDCANLSDEDAPIWSEDRYDVIFCRNVIMYFTPQVQRAVVARLATSLAPGGYLFLGHAETLRGLSQEFDLIHTHGTFYYQRRAAGRATAISTSFAAKIEWPIAASAAVDTSWFKAIGKASRRVEALVVSDTVRSQGALSTASPEPSPLPDILELLAREEFAEALERLDRLAPDTAADDDLSILRAVLLAQSGSGTEAAALCRSLIAREQQHAGANYILGLCLEDAGDHRSALLHYDLATHIDPLFAMPYLRRGLLALRAGEVANARTDLSGAAELLASEEPSRLLLFGGGFSRAALIGLCRMEPLGEVAAA